VGRKKEKRIADLEKEIAKRNRWIDQRDRRIDRLEQEIERLRRENEKLQQAAKRHLAPFSRGEPKRNPRQRGRKAGSDTAGERIDAHRAILATNFLAERAFRPAVVNRKLSAGNNTPRGAKAQATLMTVLHSARKRSVDTITLVVRALQSHASVQQLL